ncbi:MULTISPECIES: transcriptional regulator GcvA [Burkholderia]|uniref:transcriptional regulator GcvA n=1 Tax=Burkholderia TaxID=32008 RepID=UPI000B7AB4B6|nr:MULTISPECIES: transcriptional regulator GcvA [Burkholderia]MBY4722741.1 transcriptional regulator GcvA [Burkholderia contaminans]MCI3967694.1 transcriptional regulator GcvA [Burkholderia sp. HI4860]MDN7791444.1 transcriptional regulator GcvA [Burkholderia contaminans]OXI97829.1 LysR family transcriptional regulator [Burkholderia sp. AU33647]
MNENRSAAKRRDALPPLNALRAFDAVARHGSFAGAAEELHVTHWAVGKQIRLLEDWFGLPLFDRRPRGVVLTDEGAALLSDVSNAFERLGTAVVRLRHDTVKHRISGVVRVNVTMSFALCWLLPRLADFHLRYPDIDVSVSTTSRKLRYVADAFDIGVRSGPEHGAGVVSRPLMPDLRVPACNPALLRQHPIQSVTDLRHHTLLHSATTRSAWSHWLQEAGVPDLRAARHVEFDHVNLQLGAAIEGLGVALASLPLIRRDLAEGRLVCPIASPAWRADDYMLVTNTHRVDDAAVSAFEQWMEGMARQEAG